ncbi:hypothetical protein J1C56_02365 [Aminobacter anthyllidis]|uniref:Uncharacterized protein n=1 Tax=Aminobacter anthyllidis TaxID=1035067 RepID=A0A9X1D496_9HYPH|nr:hypothetical protein [Aminobacter anthyllidis]MBT1154428.1 hypothetical protein [Aminobacter anthyllidis]
MSNFDKAFAAARKAGKKGFTFGGKKFNTKLASGPSKKTPKPSPKPAQPTPKKGPVPTARPDTTKTGSTASGPQKLTIGDRIVRSVRIGETAVNRGRRRDAAQAKNAGAGDAIKKMLSGMDKPRKK